MKSSLKKILHRNTAAHGKKHQKQNSGRNLCGIAWPTLLLTVFSCCLKSVQFASQRHESTKNICLVYCIGRKFPTSQRPQEAKHGGWDVGDSCELGAERCVLPMRCPVRVRSLPDLSRTHRDPGWLRGGWITFSALIASKPTKSVPAISGSAVSARHPDTDASRLPLKTSFHLFGQFQANPLPEKTFQNARTVFGVSLLGFWNLTLCLRNQKHFQRTTRQSHVICQILSSSCSGLDSAPETIPSVFALHTFPLVLNSPSQSRMTKMRFLSCHTHTHTHTLCPFGNFFPFFSKIRNPSKSSTRNAGLFPK